MFPPYLDPRLDPEFAAFYNNPVIQKIRNKKAWTMSMSIRETDDGKAPVDLYELACRGRIVGAMRDNYESGAIETLDDSIDELVNAGIYPKNHAFSLEANQDGIVILDVEPICPDELKEKFLNMNWLYGEVSMSGKGLHLVFPLPECINEYPEAVHKVAMKEGKLYEVHMYHWVTFTRRTLNRQPGTEPFEPLFRELCAKQKETVRKEVELSEEMPEIPDADYLLKYLREGRYRKKFPEGGDPSSWEYGFVCNYKNILEKLLRTTKILSNGHTYTDNEKTWLIYTVVKELIPYRDKHDSMRGDVTYLFMTVRNAVAAEDKKKG